MKYLSLLIAMLFVFATDAIADTITVDPNVKAEQVINCVLPTERENNERLDISEILKVTWFVGPVSGEYDQSIDTGKVCQVTLDTTQYPDGDRYISATVTDTEFRQSVYSLESIMTVKRQTPPAQMAAPAFVR